MTAVVVPTLLGSVHGVEEALEHLEVQYLANRDPNLQFAILSDFTDSPTEHRPDDEEILAAASAGIKSLNARYGNAGEDVFFLFHRPRLWNPKQGVWMGWERKRGKLAQFNKFLRAERSDAFTTIVGDDEQAGIRSLCHHARFRHRAAARRSAAARRHDRASAQPARTTIRQSDASPRLRDHPATGRRLAHERAPSYFAAIHSGHPGVDPYTTAVSDVYQDLYGEGSFTGKGIYDVDAFEEATHGRFPENTLLSHDLIEGTLDTRRARDRHRSLRRLSRRAI